MLNERYRLLNRVGQGGFSVVWLAEDLQSRLARVAVKVFMPVQGMDDDSLQTFRKEYELTQPLVDARLLRSTDYFVHEESPCLVFPFMQGGSLADKIKKQEPFDELEVAKLMYQIGGALQYLHSRSPAPILHLDIKPENVLINYTGEYLLADFGISHQLRTTMMRASNLKGVSMHRAPEQILNKGLGTRVDIFTLGVTLVESVNGLFEGSYLPGMAVISGAAKPKLNIANDRLEKWLHACMNLNPADRPDAKTIAAVGDFFIKNKKWPEPPPPVPQAPQPSRDTQPLEARPTVEIPSVEPVVQATPRPLPKPQTKPVGKKKNALLWLLGALGGVVVLVFVGYLIYLSVQERQFEFEEPEFVEKESFLNLPAEVKTKGADLRLRSEPDTFSLILDRIPNGSDVSILQYGEEYEWINDDYGKWCLIEYEGKQGYAFGPFLFLK